MQPKKPVGFSKLEREYWAKLNDFIRENSGWATSQPDVPKMTFECEISSELPELLRRRGFDVLPAGTAERLLPTSETVTENGTTRKVIRQHVVPTTVSVFEFALFGE